mgnify:CR=1 FL=1
MRSYRYPSIRTILHIRIITFRIQTIVPITGLRLNHSGLFLLNINGRRDRCHNGRRYSIIRCIPIWRGISSIKPRSIKSRAIPEAWPADTDPKIKMPMPMAMSTPGPGNIDSYQHECYRYPTCYFPIDHIETHLCVKGISSAWLLLLLPDSLILSDLLANSYPLQRIVGITY